MDESNSDSSRGGHISNFVNPPWSSCFPGIKQRQVISSIKWQLLIPIPPGLGVQFIFNKLWFTSCHPFEFHRPKAYVTADRVHPRSAVELPLRICHIPDWSSEASFPGSTTSEWRLIPDDFPGFIHFRAILRTWFFFCFSKCIKAQFTLMKCTPKEVSKLHSGYSIVTWIWRWM